MGIYDRDYIRRPPPPGPYRRSGLSAVRMWSVNTWIIVICVGVFAIDEALPEFLVELSGPYLFEGIPTKPSTAVVVGDPKPVTIQTTDSHGNIQVKRIWGRPVLDHDKGKQIGWVEVARMHLLKAALHFSTTRGFLRLEFWRFIGFQFLHGGLAHLFFNMLALYFFGPLVERHLGSKRYLAFYLLCGIFGAMMYMTLNLGGYIVSVFAQRQVAIPGLLFDSPATPLIGASAGVFGVLMAGAYLAPNATVLVFFVLPMRLVTLAYVMVALALWSVLVSKHNAGGEAGHLGGAIAGFYFIRHPQHLHGFFDIIGRIDPTSHHYRGERRTVGASRRPAERAQLDRILDKISSQGLHSLTEKEKRTLRQASQRKA